MPYNNRDSSLTGAHYIDEGMDNANGIRLMPHSEDLHILHSDHKIISASLNVELLDRHYNGMCNGRTLKIKEHLSDVFFTIFMLQISVLLLMKKLKHTHQ